MAEQEIDSFTGLPKEAPEKGKDSFGKDKGTVRNNPVNKYPISNPQFMYLGNQTVESYQEYGVPVLPNLDIDEMRAQRQSRAEKWGRGLMKAGVTMAGAVAENTVGIMNGIGEAVYHWDINKLVDNNTGRAIDSMNAWMQENYPNYYTKAEQEAIGFENLGYANFWGDKAANGLGYAVASIGTIWLTGGVGLIGRGVALGARGAVAASRGLGMYNAAKAVATGTKIGRTVGKVAANKTVLNAAKTLEVGISMSHAEAAVEAREMLHTAYDEALSKMAEQKGVSVQELTAAEKQEAKDLAQSISNWGYLSNMAVLAPTNLIMFGKGIAPKYFNTRPKMKGFKKTKTGQWLDNWAKDTSPLWKRTTARYLQNPLQNAVNETIQEGTQYAIQSAGERVLDNELKSPSTLNWMSAVAEGWGDTVTEKEGIESLMLGFIIGGVMGGAQGVHNRFIAEDGYAAENKRRAQVLAALNSEQMYAVADNAQAQARQEIYARRMQEALEKGDHKAYRDAQFDILASQILMHNANGSIDMFMQKLEDAKKMEPAEFAKAFGIPEGVEVDPVSIVNDVTKDINEFLEIKRKVETAFPSEQGPRGLWKLLASKETEEQKQQALEEHQFRTNLIMLGFKNKDIDSRITKLRTELNELFNPLSEEQRAEAEKLIKRMTYNSSKIKRLEKKEREKTITDEELQHLKSLRAQVRQAEASLEAEPITEEELGADKMEIRERMLDPNTPATEDIEIMQEEQRQRLRNLVMALDPMDREKAIELTLDLIKLTEERGQASFALEELMNSPESRATYLRRQRLLEEQEAQNKIDEFVDEQIEATATAAELEKAGHLARERKVSPKAAARMRAEYDKRVVNESAVYNRLNEEDVAALEVRQKVLEQKAEKETLSKEERIEQAVLAKNIKNRKEAGTLKGNRTLRKEKAEQEAADRAKNPTPTQEQSANDPVEKPAGMTIEFRGQTYEIEVIDGEARVSFLGGRDWFGGKLAKDIVEEFNKQNNTDLKAKYDYGWGETRKNEQKSKDRQTQEALEGTTTTTNPDNDGSGRSARAPSQAFGELQVQNGELESETRVVTDRNGNPKSVRVVKFENGRPILGFDTSPARTRTIDRSFSKTMEGHDKAVGSEVTFELVTESWVQGGRSVSGPVIYVKLGDEYIGVLPDPNNNAHSARVMNMILEQGEATGNITAIEYGGFGNYIAEFDNDGNPVMRPVSEVLEEGKPEGFLGYAYVQEGGMKMLGAGIPEAQFAAAEAELNARRRAMKLTPGQIVMVYQFPNGDFTVLPMSTKTVGADGLGQITQIILNSKQNVTAQQIAALTGLPGPRLGWTESTKFIVDYLEDSGAVVFNFEHKGEIISLSLEEARELITSGNVTSFSFGKMEPVTKNEREEMRFRRYETDGMSAVEIAEHKAKYNELRAGMKEAFLGAIEGSKSQVDGELLETDAPGKVYTAPSGRKYDSYTEYVETELLQTNVRFHKGLPTYDHRVVIKLNTESVAEEQAVNNAPSPQQQGPKVENPTRPTTTTAGSGVKHTFKEEEPDFDKQQKGPASEEDLAALEAELAAMQEADAAAQEEAAAISKETQKVVFNTETGEVTEATEEGAPTQEQQAEAEGELSNEEEERFYGENSPEDLDYYSEQMRAEMGKIVEDKSFFDDGSDIRVDFVDTRSSIKIVRATTSQRLSEEDVRKAAAAVLGVSTLYVRVELRNQDTGAVRIIEQDPFRLASPAKEKIDRERAIAWLSKRFGDDAVIIYDQLKMVGDEVIHGYMTNGAVHLYSQAEVGTEYHEGFHLFFRTLLTTEQREQLYEDAVAIYGEPTAEDIAKARRGQPNLTDKQARLLAIEENLAEKFRDYVITEQAPKSLGKRIAKFFKDLLIYIKALAGYPMTVRTAFSMIESNRIPKYYARNAQAFAPSSTAFRMRQFAADVELGKELRDIVVYKALTSMDENPDMTIEDLLGSPATANVKGGPSVIRNWFLRHAFHVKDPILGVNRVLNDREFRAVEASYDRPEMFGRVLDAFAINLGAPDLTVSNDIMPDQMAAADMDGNKNPNYFKNAKLFMEVYEHWHDKRNELGGVEIRGFRADVRDRLRDYGIKTFDSEVVKRLSKVDETDEGADRIYSVSRSKVDPASTLGDKARRALSRIPVQGLEKNRLGFQTYIPLEDIYNEIAAVVSDSVNFVQMMDKIGERAKENSTMQTVYEFMNNLTAPEKALMYSVFAQSMTKYKLVKVERDSSGRRVVKIIDSSVNSIERYFQAKWAAESTSPGGLYTVEMGEDGDVQSITVDEARRERAVKQYEQLQLIVQGKHPKFSREGTEQYRILGDIMLELGINIAPNLDEAARRIEIAFREDKIAMSTFLTQTTGLDGILNPNRTNTALGQKRQSYSNIFEKEGKTMNAISNIIMAKFETPKATSFFNGVGDLVFPVNLKSDLDITTEMIKSGELSSVLNGNEVQNGVVGSAAGELKSLANLLVSDPNGREIFEFVDIDSLKIDDDMASEFEEFSYTQGLLVDLAMFANNSTEFKYIAIDTQGDRSKLTYMKIPNFADPKIARKYGMELGVDFVDQAIRTTVMLDLHRMHVAQQVTEGEKIVPYHDFVKPNGEIVPGKYTEFQLGGTPYDPYSNIAPHVYAHLENGVPLPKNVQKYIDKYVEDTRIRMEGYVQDIVTAVGGEEKLTAAMRQHLQPGPKKGSFVVKEEMDYLRDFVEMSVLGRLMSRELLRGGINYVKDGATYVKRSALSSTPGTLLFTLSMNTDPNNPNYGMLDEFNEITINDVLSSLPTENRDALYQGLIKQVGEGAAASIMAAYEESVGTDGQGVITIPMYRRIRMGLGQWNMAVDEVVYQEYMSQPIGQRKWDGERSPIKMLKPSVDGRIEEVISGHRHLVPVTHKNSYIVMTDELAAGIPELQNLVQFMEKNNVHVANTISTKKLASYTPVDINDLSSLLDPETGKVRMQTIPSKYLKFPQILPEKRDQVVTFGRQPRKNMIANIKVDGSYYLEDLGVRVTGRQLVRMYQSAVSAKLKQGHAKVLEELGYNKILEARKIEDPTKRENAVAKATQDMLPKLRDILTELGIEKDIPQNILDSLNIIVDDNGVMSTTVPLSFPTIQSKLDSLVMGMFKRNAYLQKLTGMEVVQFAEFGGHKVDGSLGFYTIEEALDKDGKTYSRVAAAEVDIRRDVIEAMGIDPDMPIEEIERQLNEQGTKMLGYRIPQQGKSSMLMMKIRKILPKSHVQAVRVPPAVTTMMGSDFDIDKMFIIFPEIELKGRKQPKVSKVIPDYEALINSPEEAFLDLDEKVLNNIVFDTFMSIASSPQHLHESITPLDMAEKVDPIITGVKMAGSPTGRIDIDINNPHARLQTAHDNMLSMRLRGAYANGIAGRNVALTAMAMGDFVFADENFVIDNVPVGNLVENALFPDPLGVLRPTDYYLSQYLNKAVDSVNNPIQALMNDNKLTAKLTTYMISIGMTPQQAIVFLNHPAVREVTDEALRSDRTLRQTLNAGGKVDIKPMVLNTQEMVSHISNPENVTPKQKEDYKSMLAFMNQQADKLGRLYRVLSPDNIDQSGTTPQHLAMAEERNNIENNKQVEVFGGLEALNNVLYGDAYPIVKAYYEAIDESLKVVSALGFVSVQPAVVQFREDLKKLAGIGTLNDVQLRDINRAVLHHMVTKPGSPIYESGLLDAEYIYERFARGGIAAVMDRAKQAAGGAINPVFDAFTIETDYVNGFPFTYLKVDKTKLQTKTDRDVFTYTMQGMMDNPALYGEENTNIVRDALRTIITNSIITTGFAPGMKSYFELIPVELWRNMGVTEHLNQEMHKLRNDPNYLSEFKTEYLSSYGTHSARRQTLFERTGKRSTLEPFITPATENSPPFMIQVVGNRRVLFQRAERTMDAMNQPAYRYIPVRSKGKQYSLYEAHLRVKKTGEKFQGSIFDTEELRVLPSPGTPSDTWGEYQHQKVGNNERETPKGAEEKIARLKASFAKAGINVKVVETQLPIGVKGQVKGDTVEVDPSQMTTDTTYHEFGHILIDMLPEDQVDKYIEQVIAADPALANAVTAQYPELSGRALGKEILVTAIGREGAKIERKNPSKLRILINKVLRAIGKLFGVTPNAAAVLAEQMFAGDIKSLNLSGKFNSELQRSIALQEETERVYRQVRDSLVRQKFRLEQIAETSERNTKIREVEGLIRNIDELRDNVEKKRADLNEFFDFYQYVVGRTTILKNMMDDMIKDESIPRTEEELLDRSNRIDAIRQTLESLYTEDEANSTLVQMVNLLRTMQDEGILDAIPMETSSLIADLENSLFDLRKLNKQYYQVVIPATTKALLSYASPEAAAQIQAEKKRVQQTRDLSGYRPMGVSAFGYSRAVGRSRAMRNPEFKALNAEYFQRKNTEDPMTREEFDEKALEIKLKDIDDKMIGSAQITQELTEAKRSKSWFSYMLDPIVYSNQQSIQLFALALKDALYKANDETIDFIYRSQDVYKRFKDWKGGLGEFNAGQLYEDILTEVTMRRGGKTIKVLSLVQEFDTDFFQASYYNFLDKIDKQFNKPKRKDSKEKWTAWYRSQDAQAHALEKARWFAENTVPIKGAEAKYKAHITEMNSIEDKIRQLAVEDNPRNREEMLLLRSDFYKLEAERKKMFAMVDGKPVYMGKLAKPNKSYKSEKWKKIQETPELKEFYDFMVKEYHASQAKIGNNQLFVNNWEEFSYIMPAIRKDGLGTLAEDGVWEFLKEKGRDFRRLDTDTEFGLMTEVDGQEMRGIPKYYTKPVESKNISRDVMASMAQFAHMANNYEQKSKVAGLVNSMLVLHERKGAIKYRNGVPIVDQVASMSRKAMESLIKRDSGDNRDYAHLKDFVDSVFYGVADIDEISAGAQKTVGKIVQSTAVLGLAANILQVGNQAILDNLVTAQEAFTKQFFSADDWRRAIGTYLEEGAAVGDVGAFAPSSKLGQAMLMFDALQEATDSLGADLGSSRFKKILDPDNAFILQHGVEHQTAGVRMLAVLKSTKVKDKDGNAIMIDGREADMWDMLIQDENGRVSIDPRVANVKKREIIAKIHGIAKRTNQVKGSFDRAMAQRTAVGKFLMLFRNYFIPGFRRRYGHGDMYHVDHELGQVTKGFGQTFANGIRSIIDPTVDTRQYFSDMGELDRQNWRRIHLDAAAVIGTTVLFNLLSGMIEDDDDDYLASYFAYQALRLRTELTAMYNPQELPRMLMRPMASVNLLEDTIKFLEVSLASLQYNTGLYWDEEEVYKAAYYQRKSGPYKKGDSKFEARLQKLVPFFRNYKTWWFADESAEAVQEKLKFFK